MSIITNQDYLNALYGYKRIHCPKLTGLSKQQLGQLARKMGLDVIPSGSKIRPDGLGTGKHKYKQRLPTTWRGTAQQRELERNRAFNEYFDRRERGDMRAERLEKTKRRDEELERVKAEQERAQMGEEDKDAPAKPKKIKIKKKVKKSMYRRMMDDLDDKNKEEIKEDNQKRKKLRQKNMTPAQKKKDDDITKKLRDERLERRREKLTDDYIQLNIVNNKGDALEDMMKEFKGLNLNLDTDSQKKRAIDSLIEEMGENFYVEVEKRMNIE